MSDAAEPKIIVDEDFKAQVEREKEEVRRRVSKQTSTTDAAEKVSLPPASIESLVAVLGTQALNCLGLSPDGSAPNKPNLPLAKFHIDLLEVLQEKTRMNLTGIESDALKTWLHQLRLYYVEVSKNAEASKLTT